MTATQPNDATIAAIRRCLDAVLDDRVLIQERCEGHLERLNARSEASLGAFLG